MKIIASAHQYAIIQGIEGGPASTLCEERVGMYLYIYTILELCRCLSLCKGALWEKAPEYEGGVPAARSERSCYDSNRVACSHGWMSGSAAKRQVADEAPWPGAAALIMPCSIQDFAFERRSN